MRILKLIMGDNYYILEDKTHSIATILKTNPTNMGVWLEELCNVADVSEETDKGENRSYLLSYCDRKGGAIIEIDRSGIPILGALDNLIVRQIPIEELLKYQKKWLREPKKG